MDNRASMFIYLGVRIRRDHKKRPVPGPNVEKFLYKDFGMVTEFLVFCDRPFLLVGLDHR